MRNTAEALKEEPQALINLSVKKSPCMTAKQKYISPFPQRQAPTMIGAFLQIFFWRCFSYSGSCRNILKHTAGRGKGIRFRQKRPFFDKNTEKICARRRYNEVERQ